MARWTGTWLSGVNAALGRDDPRRPEWRGQDIGLPRAGVGSAASVARRAAGFGIDLVLAGLVASVFTAPELPRNWSLVAWFVITVVPVSIAGFTPGMAVTGIRVARIDGASMVGPVRALVRAVLTALIVPAVIWNFDGRSWHDRASGTVVVRR